jgi:Rrf2 family protein
MKLSRTTEYAIQAVLLLAQSTADGAVSATQLAAVSRMPERFLLQVLRNLVKHGILTSRLGVVGGFNLHRKPEDVSLLNLIEAVEGPIVACVPASQFLTDDTQTKVRQALHNAATATRAELSRLTLKQLLESPDVQLVRAS